MSIRSIICPGTKMNSCSGILPGSLDQLNALAMANNRRKMSILKNHFLSGGPDGSQTGNTEASSLRYQQATRGPARQSDAVFVFAIFFKLICVTGICDRRRVAARHVIRTALVRWQLSRMPPTSIGYIRFLPRLICLSLQCILSFFFFFWSPII